MNSDVEHFSLWKDYAYKVMFRFKKFHTACFFFLDKAAYIFNILLQFIVSPPLSVQCLPSSKRIQKNRFGHYLQEHVISELSKLRV